MPTPVEFACSHPRRQGLQLELWPLGVSSVSSCCAILGTVLSGISLSAMRRKAGVPVSAAWFLRKACASRVPAAADSLRTVFPSRLRIPHRPGAGTGGAPGETARSTRLRAWPPRCISFPSPSILEPVTRQQSDCFPGAGGGLQQYWVSNTGCPGPRSESWIRPLGRAGCCQRLFYAFSRRLPCLWFPSDSDFPPSRL
jgi:hypothetical protein